MAFSFVARCGRLAAVLIGWSLLVQPALAYTPNDPRLGEQWYLQTIGAPSAWDLATGSADVVVAVLDSGFDMNHPDLSANIWSNTNEIAGDGVDNDQNGYVDDTSGWDFVQGDNTPEPDEGESNNADAVVHGTAIGGVIGAMGDNSEGVAGLAWNIRLMPLRILDNFGAGNSDDARLAVRYAVDNGADVINLSFTGFEIDPSFSAAVEDAFEAGVVIVAAVGNTDGGGTDLDETPIYPACFRDADDDWVIGVTATTDADVKADFSNYGSDCADIAAPGEGIFSTTYQNPDWDEFTEAYEGGWSGTSIASPMVAGAAALLKSAYPSLRPTDVLTILQLSVDPIAAGSEASGELGAGRLNVGRALQIAPSFVTTPEAPPADEDAGIVRDALGHRVAPSSGTQAPSPVTGELQDVSDVYPGWFVRSESFDTVYYIDEDLRRHPFWDAQTFFTWASDWDEVVWVTDATLSTLSIATPLVPKPGVVLVKIQSDPSVYAVESGATIWSPVLRLISSETIAVQMYGEVWSEYVLDVDATLFPRYEYGADIETVERVDTSILRSRSQIFEDMSGAGG